jgi:excisionase family DNA binding protein
MKEHQSNQENQAPGRVSLPDKKWMTVSEIAAFLSVPKSWIYQRTQLGPGVGIPFVKFGKYLRFDADEVIEFFKSKGMGYHD